MKTTVGVGATVGVVRKAQGWRISAYVYLISAVAALSGLLFGFDTAVINGALPFLRDEFRLSSWGLEIAAGVLLWGCVCGAAGAGVLSDRLGRRKALIWAAVLFGLTAVGAGLSRGLAELSLARFVAGLAIGIASALAPVYIAEISPPAIRGRLVSINQLAIVTGILVAYYVNWLLAGTGPSGWRWMFALAAIPSAAFFLGLMTIPESPRWLMQKGQESAARAVLDRMAPPDAVELEIREIRRSLQEESVAAYRDLFRLPARRPLKIAVALAVLGQITGINTIIYYGAVLLRDYAGQDASSALGANVLIGVVNLGATVAAMFTIDRVGRRSLLMLGTVGMGAALTALGFAFRCQPLPLTLIVVLILTYTASFALSLGVGVWVCISEIFSNAARAKATSIATMAVWVACLCVTLTFLTLVETLTAAGAFWMYAGLCVLTFVFVWRYLPETKGRSLEQIEAFWR